MEIEFPLDMEASLKKQIEKILNDEMKDSGSLKEYADKYVEGKIKIDVPILEEKSDDGKTIIAKGSIWSSQMKGDIRISILNDSLKGEIVYPISILDATK